MKKENKHSFGNRQISKREETRSLILESAKNQFDKHGFDKTTFRVIAKHAGVGLGTICYYFPDKPSLLIATLLDDLEKIEFSAFKTLPKKSSLVDKCLHIAEKYYSYYAKHPSLSRTLLKESLFLSGKFGEMFKIRSKNFNHLVEEIMLEAQKKGEIHKDYDCKISAISFLSHFLNVLYMGLNEGEFNPNESLLLLRGLLTQQIIFQIPKPMYNASNKKLPKISRKKLSKPLDII